MALIVPVTTTSEVVVADAYVRVYDIRLTWTQGNGWQMAYRAHAWVSLAAAGRGADPLKVAELDWSKIAFTPGAGNPLVQAEADITARFPGTVPA